jgi:hypothetical protein
MGFQPKGPYNLPYGDPSERAIQGETRAKNIQKFRQKLVQFLNEANQKYQH